jgi:formylmethanofuran dehydrogenase subunit E
MSERCDDWRERELRRFVRGEYKSVPWAGESWWHCSDAHHCHYAHVSRSDEAKLSYTPDERHGREGRQLRTKPGRYLAKHFGDVLTGEEIQRWAQRWAQLHETPPVQFAETPDEIERVYREGPSSCMDEEHEKSGKIETARSPAHVYGAGDLAVAYLEREERITARALCFPERKSFYTLYGERNGIVCPYIDAKFNVRIEDDFLYLTDVGGVKAHKQCGFIEFADSVDCEHCGETISEDDTQLVNGDHWCDDCACNFAAQCGYCRESYDLESCTGVGDEIWCDDCAGEHAVYCESCNETQSGDAIPVDSNTWCEDCARQYAWQCQRCDDYFSNETEISHTVDSDEEWCESCYIDGARHCAICDESVSEELAKQMGNSDFACDDCAESDWFTCEHCHELTPESERDARAPAGREHCDYCESWIRDVLQWRDGRQLSLVLVREIPAQCSIRLQLPATAGRAPVRDFRRPHVIELGASLVPPGEAPTARASSRAPGASPVPPGEAPTLLIDAARAIDSADLVRRIEARRAHEINRAIALQAPPGVLYAHEGGICALSQ